MLALLFVSVRRVKKSHLVRGGESIGALKDKTVLLEGGPREVQEPGSLF